MKNIFLLIVLGLMACQEKEEEELSLFVGTWKVSQMGKYQSAACSGDINDSEWRGLKGKGLTITLEIKKDGTGTQTITGPDPSVTTFVWYDVGESFCFNNGCYQYELTNNNKIFSINNKIEATCIDENYKITGSTSKKSCEQASTSNQWNPKECHKVKYNKET
ncbi:MAG: hypothetical protein ACKVJJ_04870 [Fidelibacterota bacterium]|jgi:hypothetical protein|tara:strand:- start:111 stop:599 length:489 start_codon:yes stop_codon:yes gene_type:complete